MASWQQGRGEHSWGGGISTFFWIHIHRRKDVCRALPAWLSPTFEASAYQPPLQCHQAYPAWICQAPGHSFGANRGQCILPISGMMCFSPQRVKFTWIFFLSLPQSLLEQMQHKQTRLWWYSASIFLPARRFQTKPTKHPPFRGAEMTVGAAHW